MSNNMRAHQRSSKPRSYGKSYVQECMRDFDDYDAQMVGQGGSAVVLAVNKHLVVKLFTDGSKPRKDLRRELKVLKQLSQGRKSPHIVKFYGRWEDGIIMERLDMTLRQRLRTRQVHLELEDQWMLEISTGLEFIHHRGVLHGDIGCHNVLIDSSGHAKLCDFAGSKLGDKKAWSKYQVRSQHPKYLRRQPNILTEIFALGSLIFEIATLHPPFEHLPDLAVQRNFENGEFPLESVDRPEIRDIVERCWLENYRHMSDICDDAEIITKRIQSR